MRRRILLDMDTEVRARVPLKRRRQCDQCHEEFMPGTYWQRFCSKKCRMKYHDDERAEVRDFLRKRRESETEGIEVKKIGQESQT